MKNMNRIFDEILGKVAGTLYVFHDKLKDAKENIAERVLDWMINQ